ncbi:MAG: porin [Vicinamibacterales bacterium]
MVALLTTGPAAFGQDSTALSTPPPAPAPPATGLSGYMDFHYNKTRDEDGQLDFHRFVLLVTHQFSDRIRFVSELELEHALVEGLEEAGELELEQAYVDFLLSRGFNVRAGMLLMPVGIINERHEPPMYYGVERPLVDTFIVPSTWFEVGAGVHGEVGRGWRYRAYVTSPLNAAKFTAEEGIRNGRQRGSRTNAGRMAATGRLEFVGIRGFTAGASFWTGSSGFEFRPRFDVPVRLLEADVRYGRNRFEGRAQLAQTSIVGAGTINDAVARTTGVNPNIASALRGAYAEASYRVVSGATYGDVGAFVRYENVDTQFRMPAGYVPLKAFDRDAWVVGGTYWPDPDIAIKVDYVHQRNQSATIRASRSFNVGLGWWF